MLHYYFQKALREDLSPSDFMNVIRICLCKAPTHCGADGEDHYSAINKRERIKNKLANVEVVEEINEDEEIEEIITTYKQPLPQRTSVSSFDNFKQISNQLKKDNKHFALLDESSIEDTDSEFDIAL